MFLAVRWLFFSVCLHNHASAPSRALNCESFRHITYTYTQQSHRDTDIGRDVLTPQQQHGHFQAKATKMYLNLNLKYSCIGQQRGSKPLVCKDAQLRAYCSYRLRQASVCNSVSGSKVIYKHTFDDVEQSCILEHVAETESSTCLHTAKQIMSPSAISAWREFITTECHNPSLQYPC